MTKRRATRPVALTDADRRSGPRHSVRKLGHEGTPELRAALREMGFTDRHSRGVELWRMFKELHDRMRDVALEIEYNERGES